MGFFEKLGFSAKKEVPENLPADASLETAMPEVREAGLETESVEVAPEIKEQLASEIQALEAVPKPESDFKRKLRRSAAIAMAALTLTAAAPAFSEAGSRYTPRRSVENGITYVVDGYFRGAGWSAEESFKERQRQQREAKAEERRQQRMHEDEARRQRLEAEKADKDQQNFERRQQQDMENQFRREQAEFRGKLNKAIEDYNRQLKDINRSYEAKKYGDPGTKQAIFARNEMAAEARRNYIQQVIDYKIAYNQQLTEQEQAFLGQTEAGIESPQTQAPTSEKTKQKI